MTRRLLSALAGVALLAAPPVAANPSPERLVETAVTALLEDFEARRDELARDKARLYRLVDDKVAPYFAVRVIARLVLARHWRRADERQRREFAEQFKGLLVRTYATALFQYTGRETMEVKPARVGQDGRRARVATEVTLPGRSPVSVDYSFLLTGRGWKIYDVSVEGVSLVTNYRSSYGEFIERRGLDGLIDELRRRNEALESS